MYHNSLFRHAYYIKQCVEIKQVYIDGELYETTRRTISYVGGLDSQRKNSSDYLNESLVSNAILSYHLI